MLSKCTSVFFIWLLFFTALDLQSASKKSDGIAIENIHQFGNKEPRPALKKFIQSILQELGIPLDKVIIRRMNRYAISKFGKQNAFVLGDINFTKVHMFISEEWFDTLSTQEKRFIIGHEAMHIKYRHTIKHIILLLVPLGLYHLYDFLYRNQASWLKHERTKLGIYLGSLLLSSLGSRYMEANADYYSALELNCVDGGIRYFKNRLNAKSNEANLPFLIKLLSWLGYFFIQTHPSDAYRLEQLEILKQELEINGK